jgi:hypothetical protein
LLDASVVLSQSDVYPTQRLIDKPVLRQALHQKKIASGNCLEPGSLFHFYAGLLQGRGLLKPGNEWRQFDVL